jgi:putative flavoprotein involved in K+ transport
MNRVDTVIVGGGQAGLAMSRCLSDLGVEHVVLERGRVAERWRSERWDSLRLLTPRWQSRLPGFTYRGRDPHGYMSKSEVIGLLETYAVRNGAPVETGVNVTRLTRFPRGYRVETNRGTWLASNVVLATGHCDTPSVPSFASRVSRGITQVVPPRYVAPDRLPPGGVLVVGASATGVQLAAEIHASGRPVTLSVGRHIRLPRVYRGRDILWWLDAIGMLSDSADSVPDLDAARRQPSLQLVGRPDRSTLDLATLQAAGIRLVGRVVDGSAGHLVMAQDLEALVAAADQRLARVVDRIDGWIARTLPAGTVPPAGPVHPVQAAPSPARLDLAAEGIRTIVWATGYHRRYPWLEVPVLGPDGEIRHRGGVTAFPGLYVLGLQFLRRRNSSWLDGVGRDAEVLAAHIAARAGARAPAVA